MARRVILRTSRADVYKRIIDLSLNREVDVSDIEECHIRRIVRSVNRDSKNLEFVDLGNKKLLRRLNSPNWNVYRRF